MPDSAVTAADTGVGLGSFSFTGISNEPGAGEVSITQNSVGGYVFSLQADRAGDGNGRVYTLTATDKARNVATATAACTVPQDQGNGK